MNSDVWSFIGYVIHDSQGHFSILGTMIDFFYKVELYMAQIDSEDSIHVIMVNGSGEKRNSFRPFWKNPLDVCGVGRWTRSHTIHPPIRDFQQPAFFQEIMGTNVSTTYITCPADSSKTLGIKLPFLAT